MSESVTATMSEVRRHFADAIERARHEHAPTFVTRRGKVTAVIVDADEYRRLRRIEQAAEDEWLNRLADESEREGYEPSLSLTEMARELGDVGVCRSGMARSTTAEGTSPSPIDR